MKRLIKLLIILVFIGGIGYGVYFVYNNTSWLTFNIPDEEIDKNNQNPVVENGRNFYDLKARELIVPEKFRVGVLSENRILYLPEGFEISVFAAGLDEPRFFDFDDNNVMYVADKGSGKLIAIADADNDGVGDEIVTLDNGLRVVHSVDWLAGDLYVGEENQISVYRSYGQNYYNPKETLISGLPTGGSHSTRTVVIGPDEKIYVSIGSSCNDCEETDQRRAAIVRYNLDGTGEEIFASGLRNSVGLSFQGNNLWAVDNGRDFLGDDLPPDEVNLIQSGNHYGWPYCYGQDTADPGFIDRADYCQNDVIPSAYEIKAHSAPLGLTFVPEASEEPLVNFPNELADNFLIALHGSWNRTIPTGYKIVRIDPEANNGQIFNFITGWLDSNGDVWGRPVGVGFDNNNIMFISDDKAGVIYRVTYKDT